MVWRIAAFVFIVYLGFKVYALFMRSVGKGRAQPHVQGGEPCASVNDMVQDPVCGVYISADQAVSVHRKGVTFYFCSEDCYRRFVEKKE
jgi:YHS domain-containing protein